MAKKFLVLAGSGEFTDSMIDTDKYLLSLAKNKIVAILPTAAGLEQTPQQWVGDGIRHFKKLGTEPFGLMVLNREDCFNKDFLEKIKEASIIYFSGGHPGYLNETLKETPLWDLVYKKYESGDILAGSSAGAMVMAEYVFSNAQEAFMKGQKPKWGKALNLINFSCILPHFDYVEKTWPDKLEDLIKNMPSEIRRKLLCIDEDTALTIENDKKVKVMGKGRVIIISNDKKTTYKSGDTFEF